MTNSNNDEELRTRAKILAYVFPPLITAALVFAEAESQYERRYEDLNDLIYSDVPDSVNVAVQDIISRYPVLSDTNKFPKFSKTNDHEFIGFVPKKKIEYLSPPLPIKGTPLSIQSIFYRFGGFGYELESSPNVETGKTCRFTFQTNAFLNNYFNKDSWVISLSCYDALMD